MKPIFITLLLAAATGGGTVSAAEADSIATTAGAPDPIGYSVSLTAGTASGRFAPYLQSAMTHGRISSRHNVQAEAAVTRQIDRGRRFSYGFGVDLMAGAASSADYARWADGTWTSHSLHPSRARVQQLYGEVKWRGVFLTLGMKEHGPALVNARLSSGDLVESGNARPIPEMRAGFIDFQDIPFTRGWVQIQGEAGWGKMMDSDWWTDHYNRYNYHVATGQWYNYKRCYFRTDPQRPLSVTVGMQAAATWAGDTEWYRRGEVTRRQHRGLKAEDFFRMLIPTPSSSEDFYDGNHLGTWDLMARYRLPSGANVKAYFSWPWEDGSGIGRRNGWDGLWGLEYSAATPGAPLEGAVVEYLDFTNQSGPIHHAPADHPDTDLTSQVTGGDDYYNNGYYNSYAYYGMSIGTPALMAPIYNLDGYPAYVANRMRGFHAAACGHVLPTLGWRAAVSYRRAWGNGHLILPRPIHSTSAMIEATWDAGRLLRGLALKGSVALDRGTMPGNSLGALLTISYSGSIL